MLKRTIVGSVDPREVVTESQIKDNEIILKRSHPNINNYNPAIMTCIRSNHDVKFIASGKDGKACAFYMTDYATKSSLSSHQMFPLIAASLKKLDTSSGITTDIIDRSKMMITKCLNRITTEQEMSGSHICHFLLGFSDKKSSHTFFTLNVHIFLAWVQEQIDRKKYFS